ncbi:hypothetical protein [Meridianimaribacter flavus]|uniref:DUF3375 domain-containing protein n=1 Tax=Meridianimaribacter flavus TaxID=571115 RepID=A0ABY2G523_9FLAO|nr:hypothetical protein [Meridianimaribacter flavus]TDY11501.1 hypothetical protein A8975_2139 [Meridianimaribacter flavus]
MQNNSKIEFNFFNEIKEKETYNQLFPQREIGLAIIYLYEQLIEFNSIDKEFTEKDIHNAFIKVFGHQVRQQTEDYGRYIYSLQEYFLDYNQETQKYVFKDYAYKFCEHAKTILKGAFNPTKIKVLCTDITSLLKNIKEDETEKLKDWLELHYKNFEPKLREQIDFLEKHIANSIEQLKEDTNFSEQKFIDVLRGVESSLDNAKEQNKELRSAYEQTKIIRTLLEERNIDDSHINDLISDVNSFISYTNRRLTTIDKRLERIQPRIRQLFSALNRPKFNSKVQKFLRHVLDESTIQIVDSKKEIIFPNNLKAPIVHIDTPSFTILRKDIELFPSKPRKVQVYKQNQNLIRKNKEKVEKRISQQKKISDWENLILSQIELNQNVQLSQLFFQILNEENDIQVAITALFNVVRIVRNKQRINLSVKGELEINNNFKDITLWKMEVQKFQ